jgi:protein TonB
LALVASALLHPLLFYHISLPRPVVDWDGPALEVALPPPPVIKRPPQPAVASPPVPVAEPPPAPAVVAETQPTILPPQPAPVTVITPQPIAPATPATPAAPAAPAAPAVATAAPPANLALRALGQARNTPMASHETSPPPPQRVLHWRSGQPPQDYAVERYIEEWAQKVERIGNLNYPEAARRQRLGGVLRLSVTLDAEGRLLDAHIERSSDQPVLDAAALHIVKLAAPFAPFGPALRAEADHLVISRTLRFSRGDRLGSQ